MRASKNRPSLNTSADLAFRWQQCVKCLKSTSSTSDHHCSDESNGVFVEHDRARLLALEHKADYFKDFLLPSFIHVDVVFIAPETMRLLVNVRCNDHVLLISTTKEQQRIWRLGLLWPNAVIAENQLALSRTALDFLQEQLSIEIRTIPKDRIQDTISVILSAVVPSSSRSSNERRLISTCLKHQLANRIVYANQRVDFVYLGQSISFRVEEPSTDIIDSLHSLSLDNDSTPFYRISPTNTSINIQFETAMNDNKTDTHRVALSDIGGLQKEKIDLSDLLLSSNNTMSPRGVLLHGPKGCGKTMLINAFVHQTAATVVRINPSDVYSRHYGESETELKRLFAQTETTSAGKKCLIIVENIESLCPNQERVTQQFERRLTTTFVDLLDRYLDGTRVILIATTTRIDSIDADIRRPGRIDEEIEITVPNQHDRLEILNIKLQTTPHDLTEEQLKLLAERTHGFTGCDLDNLCRKANHSARKSSTISSLNFENFESALTVVRPSSMREVILEVPKVKWSDIGGQHELKQRLEEMVVWPLKHAQALDRLHVQVPKGILMYGPPGCSKTMIAKAVATESGLNFLAVKGPELFSKWVGESERAVRELFRRARLAAPAIIFFDEIDAIANARSNSSSSGQSNVSDRVIATLLIEMDGIEKLKGVTIIAATNRPDTIDPALMRPGRFDRLVYVPLPDEQTRLEIFQIRFRHSPIHQNIQTQRLVELTQGYSGAEIAAVCDEAALIALRENIEAPYIEWHHFERALMSIKPRTSDEHVRRLDTFTRQHGK